MKRKLIFIVSILILTSCMFIKIDLSVEDHYNNAIKNSDTIVKFESANFCELSFNDTIYALKGIELKQCLKTIDSAIVYIWPPYCKSYNCLSVGVVQDYCDSIGYDLFVVCTDYTMDVINAQIKPKRPFFSINHLHHGSKIIGESHTTKFRFELIGKEINEGHFLEFKNGNYIKSIIIQ